MISYSRSINAQDRKTVYLQYGVIFKETTSDKFDKYLTDANGQAYPFRNEAIVFGINSYSIIEDLANKNKIKSTINTLCNTDLRAPENINIKREIFTFFGLDADKSYAENLKSEIPRFSPIIV